MIKLVAFDWNGTLLADTQTVVDCTNEQLKVFGDKRIDIRIYRENFEIPINRFFENIGLNPKLVEAKYKEDGDAFHQCYEQKVKILRTRKGAKLLLKFLDSKKVKACIFSNHTTERIKEQVLRLKLNQYIDRVLANDNSHVSYTQKGKEKKLIEYIRKNKNKPTEILIVGDTTEEIIIGRDMGTKTVAITGGHCTTTRLKAAKPDYLVNNLKELIAIIENLKLDI